MVALYPLREPRHFPDQPPDRHALTVSLRGNLGTRSRPRVTEIVDALANGISSDALNRLLANTAPYLANDAQQLIHVAKSLWANGYEAHAMDLLRPLRGEAGHNKFDLESTYVSFLIKLGRAPEALQILDGYWNDLQNDISYRSLRLRGLYQAGQHDIISQELQNLYQLSKKDGWQHTMPLFYRFGEFGSLDRDESFLRQELESDPNNIVAMTILLRLGVNDSSEITKQLVQELTKDTTPTHASLLVFRSLDAIREAGHFAKALHYLENHQQFVKRHWRQFSDVMKAYEAGIAQNQPTGLSITAYKEELSEPDTKASRRSVLYGDNLAAAKAFFQQGEYAEAETYARVAHEHRAATAVEATLLLATSLAKQQKFDAAAESIAPLSIHNAKSKSYRQFMRDNPKVAKIMTLKSVSVESIPLDQKIKSLQSQADKQHNNFDMRLEAGILLRTNFDNQNMMSRSIDHLSKAVALKPDHAKARFELGLAVYKFGNYPRAFTHLQAAHELAPHDDHILAVTAQMYFERNKPREAEDAANKARRLSPANMLALETLSQIYRDQHRFHEEVEILEEMSALQEDDTQISYRLASTYKQIGTMDRAKRILMEIRANDPHHVGSRFILGKIAFHAGRWDEAQKLFEEGAKIEPTHGPLLNMLGRTYLELGLFGEAAASFVQASKAKPHIVSNYLAAADAYADSGDFTAEEAILSEGYKINPHNPAAIIAYADLVFARQQSEDAITLLEDAMDNHPHLSRLPLMAAELMWDYGERDSALLLLDEQMDDPEREVAAGLVKLRLMKRGHKQAEALSLASHLHKEYPQNPKVRNAYGALLLMHGQTEIFDKLDIDAALKDQRQLAYEEDLSLPVRSRQRNKKIILPTSVIVKNPSRITGTGTGLETPSL